MRSSAIREFVQETINAPTPNPGLAAPLYAITHFDSSQSDSTPYGPPRKVFPNINAAAQPIVYGGPINIITPASTNPDYMWQVGTDRVTYVKKAGGVWKAETDPFQALANASNNILPAIPNDNFIKFGKSSAVGKTPDEMNVILENLFGANYELRLGSGFYVLVDKGNVLYAAYGDASFGFTLYGLTVDPNNLSNGISVPYHLNDVVGAIQGTNPRPPSDTRLCGLSLTYDHHIILTFSNGVGVIDYTLNPDTKCFYPFGVGEFVSNSIAVDEKNGIYVASNSIMRKLVWNGTTLSDSAADGAWACEYQHSVQPPIVKFGNGTGSTPTLMGFGDDPDKLVVITDGAMQMNLVAFWRDGIPKGFTERIAGQIPVTCGLTPPPMWIQSEQSVVVYGYGAFVVNNIPETASDDLKKANKLVQVALMGPASPPPYGAQRFEWDPSKHKWFSVWTRPDVSSTSMIPVHTETGNMALINGWTKGKGWEVLGMDWDKGTTVHETIFGESNFGNGAYAILQYLENQDLLFNSIAGVFRLHYVP
ncbi:MAG: hypothetical protein ACXVKH_15090 [Candidatus Angelobacter sp.]